MNKLIIAFLVTSILLIPAVRAEYQWWNPACWFGYCQDVEEDITDIEREILKEHECIPGEWKCDYDGHTLRQCLDDNNDGRFEYSYSRTEHCPEGCTISSSSQATEFLSVCLDDYVESEDYVCTDVCDVTESMCIGKWLVPCRDWDSDGCLDFFGWTPFSASVSVDHCDFGCRYDTSTRNGYCNKEPVQCEGSCTPGMTRCIGDYLQTCVDGEQNCDYWGDNLDRGEGFGCSVVDGYAQLLESDQSAFQFGYRSADTQNAHYCEVDGECDDDDGADSGDWNNMWDNNYSRYISAKSEADAYFGFYSCFDSVPVNLSFSFTYYEYNDYDEKPTIQVRDHYSSQWVTLFSEEMKDWENETISFLTPRSYLNLTNCIHFRYYQEYVAPSSSTKNGIRMTTTGVYYHSGQNLSFHECWPAWKRECDGTRHTVLCWDYDGDGWLEKDYSQGGVNPEYAAASCLYGCNPDTGDCFGAGEWDDTCQEGEHSCTGNRVHLCENERDCYYPFSYHCTNLTYNGNWDYNIHNKTPCDYGCDIVTGECRDRLDICFEGDVRCYSSVYTDWMGAGDDYVIRCERHEDDYLYWNDNSSKHCLWGCEEDLNTDTDLHEADCINLGGDIVGLRNSVDYAGQNVNTVFDSVWLRLMAVFIFSFLAFACISYFTKAPGMGMVGAIAIFSIGIAYFWVPPWITLFFVGIAAFVFFSAFLKSGGGV